MRSPNSRRAPLLLSSSCTVPFAIAASMLLLSSLVGAVDLLFCTGDHCGGTCQGCLNLNQGRCCVPIDGAGATTSVDIKNADAPSKIRNSFYSNGRCIEPAASRGAGTMCQPSINTSFTGAKRDVRPGGNRRLQSADISETKPSAGDVYSNAAFFTKCGKEGHWVLPVANFTEYFSQVNDLSDAETLDWFKSQGA